MPRISPASIRIAAATLVALVVVGRAAAPPSQALQPAQIATATLGPSTPRPTEGIWSVALPLLFQHFGDGPAPIAGSRGGDPGGFMIEWVPETLAEPGSCRAFPATVILWELKGWEPVEVGPLGPNQCHTLSSRPTAPISSPDWFNVPTPRVPDPGIGDPVAPTAVPAAVGHVTPDPTTGSYGWSSPKLDTCYYLEVRDPDPQQLPRVHHSPVFGLVPGHLVEDLDFCIGGESVFGVERHRFPSPWGRMVVWGGKGVAASCPCDRDVATHR